jgi:hypothetical protein
VDKQLQNGGDEEHGGDYDARDGVRRPRQGLMVAGRERLGHGAEEDEVGHVMILLWDWPSGAARNGSFILNAIRSSVPSD